MLHLLLASFEHGVLLLCGEGWDRPNLDGSALKSVLGYPRVDRDEFKAARA